MKLDKDEKIYSWDVVATTTKGRQINGIQIGLEFTQRCSDEIDNLFEQLFPCDWKNESETKS